VHCLFAKLLFGRFGILLLDTGEGDIAELLEKTDDRGHFPEAGLADAPLPFAQSRGVEAAEKLRLQVVERFDQLVLCQTVAFSAVFQVVTELHPFSSPFRQKV
jgi:hypothetical protein